MNSPGVLLFAAMMVFDFAGAVSNVAYQRRATRTDRERAYVEGVLRRPAGLVGASVGAGRDRLGSLFRQHPNPGLNRLRVVAVVLQVIASVLAATVLAWFSGLV